MALIYLFFVWENTFKEANGSDPGDNTNINGVVEELSAYISAKLNAGGRMKSSPNAFATTI